MLGIDFWCASLQQIPLARARNGLGAAIDVKFSIDRRRTGAAHPTEIESHGRERTVSPGSMSSQPINAEISPRSIILQKQCCLWFAIALDYPPQSIYNDDRCLA